MVVADPEGYLLSVCENGYGKRTPFGANTAGEPAEELPEDGDASGEGEAPAEPETSAEPTGEGEAPAEPAGEGERSGMHYRKQRRGGKGVRDIRTSNRNGRVINVTAVRDTEDVVIISTGGMVTRMPAHEIRVAGRNTQGVRVINLKDGDKVASLAKVAREEEEEMPAAAEGELAAPPEES
jgi:DNA gyrase subunit A